MEKTKEEQFKEFIETLKEEPKSWQDLLGGAPPQVDWDHWLRRDEWKLRDAITLSLGRDPLNPRIVNHFDINKTNFELLGEQSSRFLIAESSINTGKLKTRQQKGHYVEPKEFIRWLAEKNFSFPQELLDHVNLSVKKFTPNQKKNLRPNQIHKEKCREIAKRKWLANKEITIQDMMYDDEIAGACSSKMYSENTLRNWLKPWGQVFIVDRIIL